MEALRYKGTKRPKLHRKGFIPTVKYAAVLMVHGDYGTLENVVVEEASHDEYSCNICGNKFQITS